MNLKLLQLQLSAIDVDGLGEFVYTYKNNSNIGTGKKLDALRRQIPILESIPVLSSYVSDIKETSIFSRPGDLLEFPDDEFTKLRVAVISLRILIPALLKVLGDIRGDEDESAIYFRLPDTNDVEEAAKLLLEINKIITQVISHPAISGSVALRSWERGSLWIELSLGSILAVHVISKLANAAAIVYREILEIRLLEKKIEALSLQVESMADMKAALNRQLQMLVDIEAKQLYESSMAETDVGKMTSSNEQVERIKYSIKALADLMDRGAEIHPSLIASREVKESFPDIKALPKLVSAIKQLTSGKGG